MITEDFLPRGVALRPFCAVSGRPPSLAAAAGAALPVAPASPAQAFQNGWRWYRECQGLWFAGNGTNGVCPARIALGHSLAGSGDYRIDVN